MIIKPGSHSFCNITDKALFSNPFFQKLNKTNTKTRASPIPEILPSFIHNHLLFAYENVVLPCSSMSCGDVIHRSTLDPISRIETHGIEPFGILIIVATFLYLFKIPGVLPGMIDYYFLSAIQRQSAKAYDKDDIVLGKKLGDGGFGVVFKAELKEDNGEKTEVVVKKAREFGEAEVWMNERLMRLPYKCCAEFIAAFEDGTMNKKSLMRRRTRLIYSGNMQGTDPHLQDPPLWLVWKYEGDYTLYDLMQKKEFPYNLEKYLLKKEEKEVKMEKGKERKMKIIKLAVEQILKALNACHSSGIVHRDVKPQNCIISESEKKIKFIDLGAAADLRVGINYVPNEFLMDPRYAPPQNYIMSTMTPKAPVAPIAAFLSPVLWSLECPDRFDMFSVGMVFLQMIFSNYRSDNNLVAFNRKFENLNFDIVAWRETVSRKSMNKELKEGFEMLDMDDGAGWDLMKRLLSYEPSNRPSAASALRHRFFVGGPNLNFVENIVNDMVKIGDMIILDTKNTDDVMPGTQRAGALSEGLLTKELSEAAPPPLPDRSSSNTIAWWQQRKEYYKKKLDNRKNSVEKN